MKKLNLKIVSDKKVKATAGCGKYWLNLCGAKQG